jgi:predicted aldo/keto reductase-like oxidoreductase
MIYKQFNDWNISRLGMGNMRLPTVGERGPIDEQKASAIVERAYEAGINYFDTAFRYHNGESESFVGKVMSQFPRESWHLATKMPGNMLRYENGRLEFVGSTDHAAVTPADIFEEQLEKCRVDYFDFYLLHNLSETSIGTYMNEDIGILDYLLKQKKAGRIKYLGFSSHGTVETLERFLAWRNPFDFAQIQLNYLDWTLQNAKRKYEVLVEHNLPVVVMEPCRGGRLASLNDEATALLKAARPDDSIASWAFRFVKSLPGVQLVLSGMTEMSQLEDNLKTFSDPAPMTAAELDLLQKATASLVNLVPCTACRYCCEGCPQGLDIPRLIALHNELSFEHTWGATGAAKGLKPEELPSNCIACGQCMQVCPQRIEIPDVMTRLSNTIDGIK